MLLYLSLHNFKIHINAKSDINCIQFPVNIVTLDKY